MAIEDIVKNRYLQILALSFILALAITLGIPGFDFETATVAGSKYEGPEQEFVAVGFENQAAHSGWDSYKLNDIYTASKKPDKASK